MSANKVRRNDGIRRALLTTTMIIIVSGKNHQCMLKLMSESIPDEKQDIYIVSTYPCPKYLSATKGK